MIFTWSKKCLVFGGHSKAYFDAVMEFHPYNIGVMIALIEKFSCTEMMPPFFEPLDPCCFIHRLLFHFAKYQLYKNNLLSIAKNGLMH